MKRVFLNLLFLSLFVPVIAQDYERLSTYEQQLFGSQMHLNTSFNAMQQIQQYWKNQYTRLKTDKYDMTQCGNGESVLKVTIPSKYLFEDNELGLHRQAEGVLRPFLRLLRGKDALATVVIACYSDNNGSQAYLDAMTLNRAYSVRDWLLKQGVSSKVTCYGIGNNVPLNDNGNLEKREHNRRVSLFLVPNKSMMKLAKRKKLI